MAKENVLNKRGEILLLMSIINEIIVLCENELKYDDNKEEMCVILIK